MHPRLRWLILLLSLSLGGCSFAFVHGPPSNHKQLPYFDCTTSNVLPVLDALLGLSLVGATADAATGYGGNTPTTSARVDIASDALFAALVSASAIYGFVKTSDCVDAQHALMMRTPPVSARPYMFAPPPDPWTGRPALPPPPGVPPPAAAPAPAPDPGQ